MGNFWSNDGFFSVTGKMEVIFDDEELIFNCGNFLISVKMFCFNLFFFISDLFLIFNEVKKEVKNGDDEE